MQSFTKTLVATAIGIAFTQGRLDLEERLVDLFPDRLPAEPGENLRKLTIRHLLAMASGAEKVPTFDGDWIRNFLELDFVHEPGTAFYYNSVGSTLLGAILQRKTGQNVQEFLTAELYPYISIQPEDVAWLRLRDGIEIGGSGAFLRTEDMMKLIKLYLDGGTCRGRRILSPEYVRLATTKQNENADPKQNPNASRRDWRAGYGYQMWMCSYPGAYRADGAMGQFAIAIPSQDMVIVYTETSRLGDGAQGSLDLIWDFCEKAFVEPGKASEETCARLRNRLSRLSLPAVPCQPRGNREQLDGAWKVTQGSLYLDPCLGGIMDEYYPRRVVDGFRLRFGEYEAELSYELDGVPVRLAVGLDGNPRQNTIPCGGIPASQLLVSGSFAAPDTLSLVFRFVETCFCFQLELKVQGDSLFLRKDFLRGQVKDDHLQMQAQRVTN